MMETYSESEKRMWDRPSRVQIPKMTDQEINERYAAREKRIVTESNREKLPNFVGALRRPNYLDLRPFYQRRARWDRERQSKLIESFIINVPVPPLFLYERAYNSYEVMDGQQRISAIQAFYENRLPLRGLELWPELNGRTYADLPSKIRAGIDRRSIDYIVLLKESTESYEDEMILKQLVFERLNTGGVKLEHQEIRNCLYQGLLNSLLLELSRHDLFTEAWGIPHKTREEEKEIPKELADNPLYEKMGDAEIVLRFFALRHVEHFANGMHGFLDRYMIRSRDFTEADIDLLRSRFIETLELATEIYGDEVFRPYDPADLDANTRPQRAFYDAVMVALSNHLDDKTHLIDRKDKIKEATKVLFSKYESGTFTGRGNTKNDIQQRITFFESMLTEVLAG